MIKKAILWTNGMVMVFDEKGEQMPEYQGQYSEVKDKILKASTPETVFTFGQWNEGEFVVDKERWEKNIYGVYPERDDDENNPPHDKSQVLRDGA